MSRALGFVVLALALVSAMASYPALDDSGREEAFTVSLHTRCRLDFEE